MLQNPETTQRSKAYGYRWRSSIDNTMESKSPNHHHHHHDASGEELPVEGYDSREPEFRDDTHDPHVAMSAHQQDTARRLSTSKAQGVNQQTYNIIGASGDGKGQRPPLAPPEKTPSFFGTWWLEFLSVFLVVGMLAATVGTIYPYRNKPQPSWPYGVQLNSIVSAYFLVLKTFIILIVSACLGQLKWSWFHQAQPLEHLALYDGAARGALGSAGLIFSLRQKTLLPYLGALVTILAMVLDPFGQQLLHFYSCQVYDSSVNSSIPTTSYATAGLSSHIDASYDDLTVGSQSAINMGIYSNESQTVAFSCPTGNCTYPANYLTAGWCSLCEDVSDQLQATPANNNSNSLKNYTLPSTNFTLAHIDGEDFRISVQYDPYFWGFQVQAILALDAAITDTPWAKQGYGAAQCNFAACVKSVSGNVAVGQLNEDVVDSALFVGTFYDTDPNRDGGYTSIVYVPCLDDAERREVTSLGYNLDVNSTWLNPFNLTGLAVAAYNPSINNRTMTTIRPECIYQSYDIDITSLDLYLGSLFEGSLNGTYGAYASSILSTIFDSASVTFTSFEATWARIAQSLETWGRENADQYSKGSVRGAAYRSDTCVAIGWWWLVYPIILAAATIVFLVGTALWTRTHASSRVDWKNEALPLMFCGIERQHGGQEIGGTLEKRASMGGAVSDIKGVHEQAKGIQVKLERGVNGWTFVEMGGDSAL